jgi:sugar (pentulose or hexulose) kinase
MTGSDTSTNALFGKLQAVTAEKLGIDPVIAMSANTCGGVCGKMISPQSISVATGATGMVGRESEIFRFTFKHSIFLACHRRRPAPAVGLCLPRHRAGIRQARLLLQLRPCRGSRRADRDQSGWSDVAGYLRRHHRLS